VIHLTRRRPQLGPAELAARLVPPKRFAEVRLATYLPDPSHPSQAAAVTAVEAFVPPSVVAPASRWARRRKKASTAEVPERPALYLDGGYGVGKTHLLASLWHVSPEPKAYLTFAEMAALIGYVGMDAATDTFSAHRLVCIDEFELDDIANTLMTVTFLRAVLGAGTRVAATSNTLPDKLGEGRFAADEFRREIAAIADHFNVVRIDGLDYRAAQRHDAEPLAEADLDERVAALDEAGLAVSADGFDALRRHLRVVHPVQVGALIDGLDVVAVRGLHPMENQGDALLFAHFVDEVYDAGMTFVASGCKLDELFPASYRRGGFRKKYGRCLSRLAALLGEAEVANAT
jgi:cell division protein ZapE